VFLDRANDKLTEPKIERHKSDDALTMLYEDLTSAEEPNDLALLNNSGGHGDVLVFEEVVHHSSAIHTSKTRLFEATLLKLIVHLCPVINLNRARIQLACDTQGTIHVARPDACSKSVLIIIRQPHGLGLTVK
jgi:hypothetical protein